MDKAKHIIKRGKANGLDNLSNEMISSFLELFPHILLTLFNCILEKNITINEWTVVIITAIRDLELTQKTTGVFHYYLASANSLLAYYTTDS